MAKIAYISKRFRGDTLDIIRKANRIIAAYQAQGYILTLRQLYYRFIAEDLFPDTWIDPVYNARHGLPPDTKNTLKNYKRLGSIVNDGRLAGLIDWDAIEDRTRNLESNAHWSSPGSIVRACAKQFRVDLWKGQQFYVEVWLEKEALVGVIEESCETLDVPFFACRGYPSQSEMHSAALRLIHKEDMGLETVIFHLGDHDPSGIDMTRDIRSRMAMFGCMVDVRRIALTMGQISEYDPPPNPAKTTDARYEGYRNEYGDDSWELDALEPRVLNELIQEHVKSVIDWERRDEQMEKQDRARNDLRRVAESWHTIVGNLSPEDEDED
jgi:hypothetical protein